MDYLFANPIAGEGHDAGFWQERLRTAGIDVEGRVVTDLAQLDALTPEDRLLVAGGDGTMSLVAPRCVEIGCAMGVLPSGTGNDFARGLGIPLEPDDASEVLRSGATAAVDVGVVGDTPFLNVAHIGLGSEISRQVNGADKSSWGRFSYLRRLLEQIQQRRGFRARIRCGDEVRRGRWLEIAIANGRSFGGGHEIVDATPFDGKLDVVAIRPRSIPHLLFNWLRMTLLRQTPADHVVVTMRGTECEVTRCKHLVIMADGEERGSVPQRFHARRGVLRVVGPRTLVEAGGGA